MQPVEEGASARPFRDSFPLAVTGLAWRGDRLAAASHDGMVRLFDATSHATLASWPDVGPGLTSVGISADGEWVAAAAGDGILLLTVEEAERRGVVVKGGLVGRLFRP